MNDIINRSYSLPFDMRILSAMKASLEIILQKLKDNRELKQRPFELEEMTLEQIFDEKLQMQSSLLQFEKIHGHPQSKEEKDIMKDIYDRYRMVKKIARRSSSVSILGLHVSLSNT